MWKATFFLWAYVKLFHASLFRNVKVKFTLEQVRKVQNGRSGIALPFV